MSTTRKIEGEQKPLPPLVSDEYLRSHTPISEDWPDGPRAPVTPTEVRNLYEADRQRTREVVQSLVDALKLERDEWHKLHDGNCETIRADEALSLAAELNITPKP